jgi:formate hydrogenlyase transcriptional activator
MVYSDAFRIATRTRLVTKEPNDHYRNETEILLSVSNAIANTRDKRDLLHAINSSLKSLFDFTHSAIGVINPDLKSFRLFLLDPGSRSVGHAEYQNVVTRPSFPITDGVFDAAIQSEAPIVFDLDQINAVDALPPYLRINYDKGIREAAMIALRTDGEALGVLGLFADHKGVFTDANVSIIRGISDQLAVAVKNILANEEIEQHRREIESLLSISNTIASIRDKNALIRTLKGTLRTLFNFNDCAVVLFNDDRSHYRVFLSDCEPPRSSHPNFDAILDFDYPSADGIHDAAAAAADAVIVDIEQLDLEAPNIRFIWDTGLREIASIRLHEGDRVFGVLTLLSETKGSFTDTDRRLLRGVSDQVSIAISNVLAHDKIASQLAEIERYKQRLEDENTYLQEEIEQAYSAGEIVGRGAEMQKVFRLISQVSASESTVLILGETGTGKELVARAIHGNSRRSEKLMVRLNCAALPPTLVESELFGHERGSFTGAVERRLGKFELANNGTLFLDEVAELPIELQSKLLRAVQEREIERVGGSAPIKVNVRIIAATNRRLIDEVNAGRFRSDLFYRLNVFPIALPPLRERREDIPVLASHFATKFARNAGTVVSKFSEMAMRRLLEYGWPGNVRELEHVIERAILLSGGSLIREEHLPIFDGPAPGFNGADRAKTIFENERDHILAVLRQCNGRVSGAGGAAEVLGIPPSTLNSRIRKLGIQKTYTAQKP